VRIWFKIFQDYSSSFLDRDLANNPSYLLVADKQLAISEEGFYQAIAFMNRMVLRYAIRRALFQ